MIHSIRYPNIEQYFYLFAVRQGAEWLSWEGVEFYAQLFDLPTVSVLALDVFLDSPALYAQKLIVNKEMMMNWYDIEKIYHSKGWQGLVQRFDWVADMQGVEQDKCYHAEGDVAVHIQSVLDALQQHTLRLQLVTEQAQIVWLAALMHDIEKRSTTQIEDNGVITSAGHAKKVK